MWMIGMDVWLRMELTGEFFPALCVKVDDGKYRVFLRFDANSADQKIMDSLDLGALGAVSATAQVSPGATVFEPGKSKNNLVSEIHR